MNIEKIVVEQASISSTNMRKVVDLSAYSGPCLHHAYRSANLFASRQTDVSMALGISVLDQVAKYKLPLGAIMPMLGNLVYFGLAHLAAKPDNWRWDGDAEKAEVFKFWLHDGNALERQRRTQELLGITALCANRFVLLDSDHGLLATDDIVAALTDIQGPPPIVFDAERVADTVDRALTGALFICRQGEAQ